jgi:hypothetical protein
MFEVSSNRGERLDKQADGGWFDSTIAVGPDKTSSQLHLKQRSKRVGHAGSHETY